MSAKPKSKASRRARDAKHVRLYLYMLKSPAWLALSCQAKCLLIELLALYNGTNNGELYLSVRSAATLLRTGMRQARAAFAELEDRGFIRATRKGSRTRRGETRLATCWRLTEHDDDLTGRQPTKEFMTWRPGEKNPTVAPQDTHRGPTGHGTTAKEPKSAPDRGPRGHAQAHFEATTVAPEDTQLVNHIGYLKIREAKSRAAPPTAAPDAQSAAAQSDQIRQPPRTNGPAFGRWLEEEGLRRDVPPEYVADALGIGVNDLYDLTKGRVQWTRYHRERAMAALDSYKPNGGAP